MEQSKLTTSEDNEKSRHPFSNALASALLCLVLIAWEDMIARTRSLFTKVLGDRMTLKSIYKRLSVIYKSVISSYGGGDPADIRTIASYPKLLQVWCYAGAGVVLSTSSSYSNIKKLDHPTWKKELKRP